MATLRRVKVLLSGFPGGPGVATYCFSDVTTALASLGTMWTAFATTMPADVHYQVEGFGDLFDDATGAITGEWSGTAPAAGAGGGGGGYAGPAGAVVTWLTSTIADGRRVRGRTFVVPLSGTNYQNDGSLNADTIATLSLAAGAFRLSEAATFSIWHRPRLERAATAKLKFLAAHPGASGLVTDSVVHDRIAILRSRRG